MPSKIIKFICQFFWKCFNSPINRRINGVAIPQLIFFFSCFFFIVCLVFFLVHQKLKMNIWKLQDFVRNSPFRGPMGLASCDGASSAEGDSCEFGSGHYFALCGLGGIISCGLTHTMVVPLDLVKCRMQVDPVKYKSVFNGFSVTLAEDGIKGLSKGWAPTFFGYSMQGLCKFGLYEVFKVAYSNAIGEENSYLWRTSLYLAASASAEFFADIALSPMEAAKVRQKKNNANPTRWNKK